MRSRQKTVISIVVAIAVSLGVLVTGVQAQSGSLEPPPSAVTGGGDPVPTTQTQPSWDQTLPAAERFVLVMGGAAVLDKNTGLVWERTPDTTSRVWIDRFPEPQDAGQHCLKRDTGGQMGWRLPSIHELTSLVVPGNPNGEDGSPDLPTCHPFVLVSANQFYWSATSSADRPEFLAWFVNFETGLVSLQGGEPGSACDGGCDKEASLFAWCVRGGSPGPDAY